MIKICCTLEKPDYTDVPPWQKQKFGLLVHQLRKKGYSVPDAQKMAYDQLWCDEIPFN